MMQTHVLPTDLCDQARGRVFIEWAVQERRGSLKLLASCRVSSEEFVGTVKDAEAGLYVASVVGMQLLNNGSGSLNDGFESKS